MLREHPIVNVPVCQVLKSRTDIIYTLWTTFFVTRFNLLLPWLRTHFSRTYSRQIDFEQGCVWSDGNLVLRISEMSTSKAQKNETSTPECFLKRPVLYSPWTPGRSEVTQKPYVTTNYNMKVYKDNNTRNVQGGSNMTGTDWCVNKPHCAAAVRPWESEATTSTLPSARVRTCSVLSGSC